MSKLCTISSHQHKTEARSIKCRERMLRYRADKAIEKTGAHLKPHQKVDLIRHLPPRTFVKEGVEYWIFYEDSRMKYR